MNVLVINAGSSSLKYQLMDPETGKVFAKGLCERIGLDGKFTYKPQVEGKETIKAADVAMPTHSEAIQTVLNALVDPQNGVISSMKEIDAVGHRVVHGGETFASSVLINDEVLKAVEDCTPLAPLHNPANIIGIEACRKVLGDDVPQVAVFDTAFHQTMPEHAYLYSIPYKYYENDKLRRYGFHGTSHRYVTLRAAELLGKDPKDLKIVSCHLGNGSSLAAVDGGKCVDTVGMGAAVGTVLQIWPEVSGADDQLWTISEVKDRAKRAPAKKAEEPVAEAAPVVESAPAEEAKPEVKEEPVVEEKPVEEPAKAEEKPAEPVKAEEVKAEPVKAAAPAAKALTKKPAAKKTSRAARKKAAAAKK